MIVTSSAPSGHVDKARIERLRMYNTLGNSLMFECQHWRKAGDT